MPLLCGIDEAGRGPVLGPLVVCGVAVEEKHHGKVERMGLRDSKVLARADRERLFLEIHAAGILIVVKVFPAPAVDAARRRNGLNALEAKAMAAIIRRLAPVRVWVDGLTNRPHAYGRLLAAMILPARPEVVSESKADERYPLVQAASIVAKVTRDAAIASLAKTHGDIGSGYPGDPKTMAFLRRCLREGEFPPFVRRSWATVTRLTGEPAGDA